MIDVVLYETEEGQCPFADWFNGVESNAALKVRTAIARMEIGNFGDVKRVGNGVSERRIDWGPGYRVYFGRDGDRIVVLLLGGTKKRQSGDIQKAIAFWADYRKRKGAPVPWR
jgi:putative addiction module killer protein